jgi:hypothetical protein
MKAIAILKLALMSVPAKIEKGRTIVQNMMGNVYFSSPMPALETVTGLINNLETAHLAAANGGTEDTAIMRVREQALDLALKTLAAYVESVANANPTEAEAIVLSAGMDVKRKSTAVRNGFEARSTGELGVVMVRTPFMSRTTTYEFQVTTTPEDEASWKTVQAGTRSKLILKGLTSATRYFFRVRLVNSEGIQPWSEVKSAVAL